MIYVLFNPLANNSHGQEDAKKWSDTFVKGAKFLSVIGLDAKKFLATLKEKDELILCGGDGTLNRFVNETYGYQFKCKVSYAKCGSGNDFYRDVAQYEKDGRVDLKPFIKHLPLITVNGIKRRFINGIGYGIDGDTCLIGDEIRKKDPTAKINYSSIAVKLLLTKYKVKNATIKVDGEEHSHKRVWLASAMYGRYYGGGMMAAPSRDRLKGDYACDVCVLSSRGRVTTLLRFPKFSAGKHDKKKYITHYVGKHITVTFDKPCALQIDGDVVADVTSYTVDCN